MQYFKPDGEFFVGDCLPFFHKGTFHFVYLLDENHHQGKGGLGGHQWAHASSTDLQSWTHHPLMLAIDEEWEGSICTGSVFFYEGIFYAFYATRKADWTEHLSLATSTDGIRFQKTLPNPFASPPEGYASHYRDPFVFQEPTGKFHMLVTAARKNQALPQLSGCLAHLTSSDLSTWNVEEPFIVPGFTDTPECPDYFEWNGWYYLLFSNHAVARYRMSRFSFGPWIKPPVDTFDSNISRVLKSAAFTGGRRIGISFLPTRRDGKNDGEALYAGNAIFREIVQFGNGTLGSKFPSEMIPTSGEPLELSIKASSSGVTAIENSVVMENPQGFCAAGLNNLPADYRFSSLVEAEPHTGTFGLLLRGNSAYEKGCELRFFPDERRVELGDQSIYCVEGLDEPFQLDVVVIGDIFDVCINNCRCLIQRAPESTGDNLFLFCRNGKVAFRSIEVRALQTP